MGPYPLRLSFSGSAAPLELIDKSPTGGIALDPTLPGTWTWEDDHTLRFMPVNDWPVGQHYEVQIDPKLVLALPTPCATNQRCA